MLIPKRTKYRKQQRPTRRGMSKGGNTIAFGDYGIQALAPAYVTNRQIEAARIAMTRFIKRGGRVWITIFPDRPLTKHPLGARGPGPSRFHLVSPKTRKMPTLPLSPRWETRRSGKSAQPRPRARAAMSARSASRCRAAR